MYHRLSQNYHGLACTAYHLSGFYKFALGLITVEAVSPKYKSFHEYIGFRCFWRLAF